MEEDRPRPSLGRPQGWDPVWQRPVPPSIGARLAPVVVFVVALVAYLRTLLPGQAFDDWGEMQSVPHLLGIAHPTGYPTFILAAHLFELLPFGSVAYRANLFSAVLVALTLATLCWAATRLGVRPAIAAAAALATGAAGTVWAAATVAEVNPLHLFLMALLLDRALAWADGGRPRDLALCGLITGLALGNHLLTLFVAPFIALFAVWAGRRALLDRPKLVFLPILTALLGLTVYAYIPIAARFNPPLAYNHPTTLDSFLFLVTGTQFRAQETDILAASSISTLLAAGPSLVGLVVERGVLLLPLAGVIGIAVLLVRRPSLGLPLVGILIAGADVWANYLELEHYLLVPFLVLGLGAAVAVEAAARVAEDWLPSAAARAAGPLAIAGASAMAVLLAVVNLPSADLSANHSGDDYVAMMTSQLPQDAAILSFWGASTPLWYAQHILGDRPDVLVIDDTNVVYEPGGTREDRIRAMVCQRPVFILRPSESDLVPTRALFTLDPAFTVTVGIGGPVATTPLPVYRVVAPAGTCP